jgi:hypothetical protein
LLLAIAQSTFDELKMIAENQAAVAFLQPGGCGFSSSEPVIGGIVVAQFDGRRGRIQTDQAALQTFDDEKTLAGGAVQVVSAGEKRADLAGTAGGTGVIGFERRAGWIRRVRR